MKILIAGGSGTFGTAFARYALRGPNHRIVVLSRGEHRQAILRDTIQSSRLECWIGDVRDRERLEWAMDCRPDVVIHAAALKRVEACEANPDEAKKTNIDGTCNVVQAAMRKRVPRVLVVSSDKACSPETTYGATKAAAEAIAIGQNAWRGDGPTRISVVRYGNILGSQGSVLDRFYAASQDGSVIALTHADCTRYWWGIEDAVAFVWSVLEQMQGAEIWVPKLTSARVADLARAIAPHSTQTIVGTRGPEKLHESMINPTEAPYTWELPDRFVLLPKQGQWWSPDPPVGAVKVPEGFFYRSDQCPASVSVESREDQSCAFLS